MVYGAHAEPQPRTLVECPDGSRPHTHSRPHTQAVEGRWVIGYALHDARENDSVPDARVCNHACGHGGFCDLRTGLSPILGRSLLRRLGWLGLGWSLVGRLGRPLAVDYSKAPLPRKLETPPGQTVVVIGDSMADWLGYGLDENYAEQPEIGVERKIRATSGLVRYDA